jgi:hypothetical protein
VDHAAVRGMTALAARRSRQRSVPVYRRADVPAITPERQVQIKQLPPMKRAGTCKEVVLFLAFAAASCVSGTEIKVRIYL